MSRLAFAAFAAVVVLAPSAFAAPLGPNAGAITVTGTANDHDGHTGSFSIQAALSGGNFSGTGRLAVGDAVVEGPLNAKLSYFENGRCSFRWESGKARASVSGLCDSAALTKGRMESFTPDDGSRNGEAEGRITLGKAGAAPAAAAMPLPTAKLTCAYQDRRIGAGNVDTQYSLAMSNMASLTLLSGGAYRTANGAGRFTRAAGAAGFGAGRPNSSPPARLCFSSASSKRRITPYSPSKPASRITLPARRRAIASARSEESARAMSSTGADCRMKSSGPRDEISRS